MAKFITIKGEVVGGHDLPDLGVNVGYGEVVLLEEVRASRSRDLSDAFRLGYVSRVRTRVPLHNAPRASAKLPKKPVAPVVSPKPSIPRPAPPSAPPSLCLPSSSSDVSEAPEASSAPSVSAELVALRQMHAELLTAHKELISNMKDVLTKPTSVIERVVEVQEAPSSPTPAPASLDDDEWGDDDDDEMFIPSKIRDGSAQLSGSSGVGEEVKVDDSLGDAAARLKALRGTRKRKKSKKT